VPYDPRVASRQSIYLGADFDSPLGLGLLQLGGPQLTELPFFMLAFDVVVVHRVWGRRSCGANSPNAAFGDPVRVLWVVFWRRP